MRTKQMSILIHRNTTARMSFLLATALCILAIGSSLSAQDRSPARGFQAGNSYALSQIEQVNLTNGNLMMNFPIASLPAGAGGSPGASVTLQYNSKIWDSKGMT